VIVSYDLLVKWVDDGKVRPGQYKVRIFVPKQQFMLEFV